MDKGIYCLILECAEPCTVKIGALGPTEFQKGWYLYVGSALVSGGLSRVSRHIRFFRERYRKPTTQNAMFSCRNTMLYDMDKGIYCLILECAEPCTVKIGALGPTEFQKGWYLYVGSALVSGGLSRVSRHIRFFRERYRKPKWHIDYLMAADEITLSGVICAKTEERLECTLAKNIGGACTADFDCSDCFCASQLFYRKDVPETEVARAFEKTGLRPVCHLIR